VYLVPLALFWRKGPRRAAPLPHPLVRRAHAPNDVSKVLSFLTTYRGLHGRSAIDRRARVRGHAPEREHRRISRVIRRSILTFLYRSERVVEGPVLQPITACRRRGALARGGVGGGGVCGRRKVPTSSRA